MSFPPRAAAEPLTVMGAGLVGSLLSLYLARRGHTVNVFERRPDPRRAGADVGRSINLALSDRGWRALEGVGVAEAVREVAIPMYRRVMHDVKGQLTHQPYGLPGQAIYSVSRGGLNRRLLELAEAEPGVTLQFQQQCLDVNLRQRELHLRDAETGAEQHVAFRRLFGTDGAFSAVRGALQKTDRFNYSQSYLEYAYKELTIAPAADGGWVLEKNALHIWPRGRYMMIALPNLDGSFTCTLFFPFEGEESFAALPTPADVEAFFGRVFPDALPLMPELTEDFFHNPTASLVTVKCFPWAFGDEALLLGDAAHAIVPFYGQGMNAGFEDCTVLNQLMDQHGDDWETIFEAFQEQRKPNADAIAEMAVYNFVEMRDRVADPRFLLQKQIESKITAQYPGQWLSLYSQVTFSHTPYHAAWTNGQRQDAIMARIMPHIQRPEDYDRPEVQDLLQQEMTANPAVAVPA
ncbi:FAD-dependent monooxygenase [Hymenobacter busanensis]|uniref:Kynurenine 3-monooxygenase n=1 Tax=Hymenobacter busanensis TaxID=2607656 RepID=A0A7L5A005_9BACT|nr:NAD(P)/FAD-dependent oxidoreductase [Hymenobacter busanensis]KAA9331360.1 FAD-dependent monooxygenase [Hymenobacter busanensis]QHJ08513.1 kynurenine 3-monooxygenase [Hymenobacter busanensis]